MPRPQFTLRALLVATLVVAAFFGGMALQAKIEAKRRSDADQFVIDWMQQAIEKRSPQNIYRGQTGYGSKSLIIDLPGNR